MKKLLIIIVGTLSFSQIVWQREIIDSSDYALFSKFSSLAFDTSGIPGVIYCDGNFQTIYYAEKSSGIWQREVIDSMGYAAFGFSLIYDNYNTPHISYYRIDTQSSQNTYLCYAKKDSIAWQIWLIETIPYRFPNWSELKTSIAVDTLGLPAIAYVNHDSLEPQYIKYACFNGNFWDIENVEYNSHPDFSDWSPSLKFDKFSNPYVAFIQTQYNSYTESLKIYTYDSLNNWVMKWSKHIDNGGLPLELELDRNHYPHVAYDDEAILTYSWWDNESLHTDHITDIGWVNIKISLDLDSDDYPHIAYIPDMQVMSLYCYKDHIWHLTGPIDSAGTPTGVDINLRINKNNEIHAVYPSCQSTAYPYLIKHAWRSLVEIKELKEEQTNMGFSLRVSTFLVNKYLNFSYYVPTDAQIVLSIYDVTGSQVKLIKRQRILKGYYQDKINIENFADGIYFITLKWGEKKVSKKFLLIK